MIITKKGIIRFSGVLVLVIITTLLIRSKKYDKQTVLVNAGSISGYTVILDAGHGQPDGGAQSKLGASEEEINLKIVLKLQKLLEQSGFVVILTRSDENGIYDSDKNSMKNKKISDLKNRVELANSEEADIFVSVHLNKIPQEKYYGWQTFYQKDCKKSKELAFDIQNNLNFSIQKENKREILPLTGKYIMDNVKIPTVTVECGFLSNEEEAEKLQKDDYQDNLAWGIYTGIMDYFYN